jgi:hypothetical protein
VQSRDGLVFRWCEKASSTLSCEFDRCFQPTVAHGFIPTLKLRGFVSVPEGEVQGRKRKKASGASSETNEASSSRGSLIDLTSDVQFRSTSDHDVPGTRHGVKEAMERSGNGDYEHDSMSAIETMSGIRCDGSGGGFSPISSSADEYGGLGSDNEEDEHDSCGGGRSSHVSAEPMEPTHDVASMLGTVEDMSDAQYSYITTSGDEGNGCSSATEDHAQNSSVSALPVPTNTRSREELQGSGVAQVVPVHDAVEHAVATGDVHRVPAEGPAGGLTTVQNNAAVQAECCLICQEELDPNSSDYVSFWNCIHYTHERCKAGCILYGWVKCPARCRVQNGPSISPDPGGASAPAMVSSDVYHVPAPVAVTFAMDMPVTGAPSWSPTRVMEYNSIQEDSRRRTTTLWSDEDQVAAINSLIDSSASAPRFNAQAPAETQVKLANVLLQTPRLRDRANIERQPYVELIRNPVFKGRLLALVGLIWDRWCELFDGSFDTSSSAEDDDGSFDTSSRYRMWRPQAPSGERGAVGERSEERYDYIYNMSVSDEDNMWGGGWLGDTRLGDASRGSRSRDLGHTEGARHEHHGVLEGVRDERLSHTARDQSHDGGSSVHESSASATTSNLLERPDRFDSDRSERYDNGWVPYWRSGDTSRGWTSGGVGHTEGARLDGGSRVHGSSANATTSNLLEREQRDRFDSDRPPRYNNDWGRERRLGDATRGATSGGVWHTEGARHEHNGFREGVRDERLSHTAREHSHDGGSSVHGSSANANTSSLLQRRDRFDTDRSPRYEHGWVTDWRSGDTTRGWTSRGVGTEGERHEHYVVREGVRDERLSHTGRQQSHGGISGHGSSANTTRSNLLEREQRDRFGSDRPPRYDNGWVPYWRSSDAIRGWTSGGVGQRSRRPEVGGKRKRGAADSYVSGISREYASDNAKAVERQNGERFRRRHLNNSTHGQTR